MQFLTTLQLEGTACLHSPPHSTFSFLIGSCRLASWSGWGLSPACLSTHHNAAVSVIFGLLCCLQLEILSHGCRQSFTLSIDRVARKGVSLAASSQQLISSTATVAAAAAAADDDDDDDEDDDYVTLAS